MTPPVDLLALGRQTLGRVVSEMARHRVALDSGLELRQGNGLLCYYDRKDRHIYLSAPNPSEPRGRFELLLLRALVGLESNGELLRLLQLLVPWLIAHEVGHHLWHRYGCRGMHGWEEELFATEFAGAFVHRTLLPMEKQELLARLDEASSNLAQRIDGCPSGEGLRRLQEMSAVQKWSTTANAGQGLIGYVYYHMLAFCADLKANKPVSMETLVSAHLRSHPEPGIGTWEANRNGGEAQAQ